MVRIYRNVRVCRHRGVFASELPHQQGFAFLRNFLADRMNYIDGYWGGQGCTKDATTGKKGSIVGAHIAGFGGSSVNLDATWQNPTMAKVAPSLHWNTDTQEKGLRIKPEPDTSAMPVFEKMPPVADTAFYARYLGYPRAPKPNGAVFYIPYDANVVVKGDVTYIENFYSMKRLGNFGYILVGGGK